MVVYEHSDTGQSLLCGAAGFSRLVYSIFDKRAAGAARDGKADVRGSASLLYDGNGIYPFRAPECLSFQRSVESFQFPSTQRCEVLAQRATLSKRRREAS